MNVYRIPGDYVGTSEARVLAEQLVAWHDSMVKHLRAVGPRRGPACADDCPHDEAAALWSAARATFGARAADLAFLRSHGQGRRTASVGLARIARRCTRDRDYGRARPASPLVRPG